MFEKHMIHNTPVIIEKLPQSRVATITIWSRCGSRDEDTPEYYGLTHFLEHMVFKGTDTRTALDIASEIEGIGGDLDAFTSRDNICFIAKLPITHIDKGISILTDMLAHSVFDEEQIKLEKSVVLEEIRMSEDDFEDAGDEHFISLIYPEKEMGRSILGTKKSVTKFTRENLVHFQKSRLHPDHMVISIAGDVDTNTLLKQLKTFIELCAVNHPHHYSLKAQPFSSGEFTFKRDGMEGVNVYCGFKTFPASDSRRYVLSIMNNIMGHGMSSRLFQSIREKKGLAYSVFSTVSYSRQEGYFHIGASTSKDSYQKVMDSIFEETLLLAENLTWKEFEHGKNQLLGNMDMALETTTSFAFFNARNEIVYGSPLNVEEIIDRIQSVEKNDLSDLAAEILRKDNCASLVYGNI